MTDDAQSGDTQSGDTEPRDELPRLLSALEDGTLDSADEARLVQLLQTDPAARTQYYDHVMLAALLRREGRRSAAGSENSSPGHPLRGSAPRAEPLTRSASPTISNRRRLWPIALAASVLLALVLSVSEATSVTHFVPTIVRIVTGEGSLLIEVDDPSVSVTLDGQDITITGAGIHELKLRPGTHKFIATKNGQPIPLDRNLVTIIRGEKQIVRVRLEPDVTAGEIRRFVGHNAFVQAVALTPDGSRALSVGWDGFIRMWDAKTGQEVHAFGVNEEGINNALQCVAISPDGRRALAGGVAKPLGKAEGVGKVWLLDLENYRVLKHCDHPFTPEDYFGVNGVAFSPDGCRALLGSFDGVVRIWDVEHWKELTRFEHDRGLWSVAYSPEGRHALVASGGQGLRLSLVDLTTHDVLRRFEGHSTWRAVFSPDGRRIAAAGGDKTLRIWDADTGKELRTLTHPHEVHGVAFCPDGRRIVTACHDGMVRLWERETARELHRFVGHTGEVVDVAVSRDGRHVLSGSSDTTVRLWELPPMKNGP